MATFQPVSIIAASPIEKLPNEVLMKIFSQFCVHCQVPDLELHRSGDAHSHFKPDGYEGVAAGYKTLNALCHTSRRLRPAAQAVMFHFIYIHSFDYQPLLGALWTLFWQPDLARHIRWLQVNVVDNVDRRGKIRGDYTAPPEITEGLANTLCRSVAPFNYFPNPKLFTEEGTEKIEAAVLLQLLVWHARAVKTLHITLDDDLEWAYDLVREGEAEEMDVDNDSSGVVALGGGNTSSTGDRQVVQMPDAPGTLHRLVIEHKDPESGVTLSEMGYLFEFAAFASLTVSQCVEWLPLPPPAGAVWTSVAHLKLNLSKLKLANITAIVGECTKLESFQLMTTKDLTYRAVDLYGRPEEEPRLISDLVRKLAERHGSSLVKLSLDFRGTEEFFLDNNGTWAHRPATSTPNADDSNQITTLSDFKVLDSLEFSFQHVFMTVQTRLSDVLPASISELRMIDTVVEIEEELHQLANVVQCGGFSALREVSPLVSRAVVPSGAGDGKYRSVPLSPDAVLVFEKLEGRFAEVGVKLGSTHRQYEEHLDTSWEESSDEE